MKKLRVPTQEEAGVLIAMLAVIFGGWARLFIPAIAGFPVNDGGLFYVMVRALQENRLRLPVFIEYNGLNIPFAYPPVAFYIGAVLSDWLDINILEILRWLPAFILIIAIAAFYFLARVILSSSFKAGVATFVYAFTPRVITWQIMGGGLTRSFGQLFLLLTITNVFLLLNKNSKKNLVLSMLFSALVVLTHPEAAIQTIGLCILFFFFKGRNITGIKNVLAVGGGALLLSSTWLVIALTRYGIQPFLSAGQTGLNTVYAIFSPLPFTFTDEPLMTIVSVLGIVGIAVQIAKRDFLIPLWFILPFFIEPRSAPTIATIPLAILASITISEVIVPALVRFESQVCGSELHNVLQVRSAWYLALFIGFYLLGAVFYFGIRLAGTTLTQENRAAFDWVVSNTPPNSRFVILTGDPALFSDSTQEWFPALTKRISLTTIQGREWLEGGQFMNTAGDLQEIQGCRFSELPLDCLKKYTSDKGLRYEYIYLTKSSSTNLYREGSDMRADSMVYDLERDANYLKIYENKDVVIFLQKP